MSNIANTLLLLSAPGLPLLLAIPALRRYVPCPAHLALLPTIVLLFLPGSFSVGLPWILWGSAGMGIDTGSRWWLTISVVIWTASATFLHTPERRGVGNRLTTLFLLTLVGQVGAILAMDMVSFFTFMTLMGYAFIGLLIDGSDEKTRRAGRIYLVLLILADIALFEALLIAATSTDDLGFEAVAHAIPLSSSSALYLSMVIAGFALKAGFWPLHVWLPPAYGSARPAVALLLWVVPVGTGLFGAVRWLPLGELTAPVAGTLLQAFGAAGTLYALLFAVMRAQWKQLPAYTAIIAMSIFIMGLGTGLLDPAVWNQYGHLVPVFVAAVGLVLAVMIAAFVWLEKRGIFPSESGRENREAVWLERWAKAIIRLGRRTGGDTLPELRASWFARWDSFRQACTWQQLFDAGEYFLQRWEFAITLFLLLGMVSVALLWLDATSVL